MDQDEIKPVHRVFKGLEQKILFIDFFLMWNLGLIYSYDKTHNHLNSIGYQ